MSYISVCLCPLQFASFVGHAYALLISLPAQIFAHLCFPVHVLHVETYLCLISY